MYWRVPLTSHSSGALITSGWHPSRQVGGSEGVLTLTGSNRLWNQALWTRQSFAVSSQSIAEILQFFLQGAAYDSCAKLLVEVYVLGRNT